MVSEKTVLGYTNLFFPNDYQKNDKMRYKYLKDKYGKRKRKPWFSIIKIYETRYYLLEEVKHSDLVNEKHKKYVEF